MSETCAIAEDDRCGSHTPAGLPEFVEPGGLFSPQRLDLCVKYLYARAILDHRREDLFERLYVRHVLLRTGGREPNDFTGAPSGKQSIDDYVNGFRRLLDDIRENGYDASSPVPVMGDGRIGNGAHRLAACRALGVPVAVSRHEGQGGTWNFDWFVRHGFAPPDLQRILHCWVTLDRQAVVIVLWPAVKPLWRQLTDLCRGTLEMVGALTLDCRDMERPAFDSLILDLYADESSDHAHGLAHIERKCDLLGHHPAELQILVMTPGAHTPPDFSPASLKNDMRDYASPLVRKEDFITCHASASPDEARHMADTLLCPEYLSAVGLRRSRRPRGEFLAWLNDYDQALAGQGLAQQDCCIVGSSPLEINGIRLSTDIDFAVREPVREGRYHEGPVNLGGSVDVVSRGYHRSDRRPWISDAELMSNPDWHFRFRGRAFAGVDIVHDRKDFSRRPKDCADVDRIDALRGEPVYRDWLHEVTRLDFRCGGNLAEFVVLGWSCIEHWGTWTDGDVASLLLPVPRLAFGSLVVNARMLAAAPEGVAQHARVVVNGTVVGEWEVRPGAIEERVVEIPAAMIEQASRFALRLEVLAPYSPGEDQRRLGLGLIELLCRATRR
ncbi:hypothetical protein [Azospirillum himalayense]|uniref:Uncharacterized protein n=1 Tax=Azospirillum himalayense TaxID=654847 RepID=A0ABW0G4M7_9PROT